MEIQFKGFKAVVVLLVAAALFVGKYSMERRTLEEGAADQLKFRLRGEYLGQGLTEFDVAELADAGDEQARAQADELMSLTEIEFTEMSARGSGDDVVVRVEIRVAGGDPPDGESVRYFRMSHSTLTGWRVLREVPATSYYLKLF